MPCSSEGYPGSGCDHSGCNREIDMLTRMLCEAMNKLEADKHQTISYNATSKELKTWWEKHKKFDRKRREAEEAKAKQERIKKYALSKLTPAERKVLGLN